MQLFAELRFVFQRGLKRTAGCHGTPPVLCRWLTPQLFAEYVHLGGIEVHRHWGLLGPQAGEGHPRAKAACSGGLRGNDSAVA